MKEEYVASGFLHYLTSQMTCYYGFPTWEQIIPNMGTNYSQRGNILFPAWEKLSVLSLME